MCRQVVHSLLLALFLGHATSPLFAAEGVQFSIPAGSLADALDHFSETTGLQTVYATPLVQNEAVTAVSGIFTPDEALNRLLEHSALTWRYVNADTVILMHRPVATAAAAPATPPIRMRRSSPSTVELEKLLVLGDSFRVLPTAPSMVAFGLNKPLLDTPRSLSVISEETIALFSLSAVEDLSRVVPGVYTTTRFGIQGAVDVRNVAADTYVRGMKRLNLQGHGRSVLGATDTIEIVRGPPSPLYGMGKIGGYTNVIPKSGRASLGGYLTERQGFTQVVAGLYERAEVSLGIGGPLDAGDKHGGYYLYGLLEDSDTYTRNVGIGQTVLQGAISLDDFVGGFRLETGLEYQRSTTSGALLNRFNQNVVDNNLYVRGQPLVNLDTNGNGAIGFLEMHRESPVAGALSSGNQPLIQRWDWPLDTGGKPLPIDQFPQVAGIPQSLYDYLQAHPEADPNGLLRAQGVGGPLPASGRVPLGFALDPRTTGYTPLDPRRAGAYERKVRADFTLAYIDLIYDSDPDFTLKNQLFFDSMDQYKLSEQPGGGKQDVRVVEDKVTLTHRLTRDAQWLQLQTMVSANVRNTVATGYRYVGDQSSHRTDVTFGDGSMTPNTTFVHPFENPVVAADGAPWNSDYRTDYWEAGVGSVLDIGLGGRSNVLLGMRFDRSRARNTEYSGTLDAFVGTSQSPGLVRTANDSASGYDDGTSWSASFTQLLPYNLRAYATVAESSLTLESNNNRIANSVIVNGHIGKASLKEAGLKASLFADHLFLSVAHYRQDRLDANEDNFAALQTANVSATSTSGWEMELKWVPMERLFLSLYGLDQQTLLTPNYSDSILVDARTLGFKDVLDANGNIVFPAEAFLYGGRSFLTLPAGLPAFAEKQGNPQRQLGFSGQYKLNRSIGFTVSGNYFSDVYSGRLRRVHLPSARVFNAGIYFNHGNWHCKLDFNNLFDEHYFRPRTGDNLGETLVTAMPGRQWLLTLKVDL